MSISADTLRGHTDTIILAQLMRGDNYGYEINKNVQQRTNGQYGFKEATLYTAFKRLESSGLITSYWGEDGPGDTVFANGRLVLQALGGTVDLFTGDPEDTALFEGIQAALDRVCCWRLNSIQYEEDTGLTHYEWRWEVPNG